MAEMREILHIGYPKAGSTWLQTRFFPAVEGVHFDPSMRALHDALAEFEIFYDRRRVSRCIEEAHTRASSALALVYSHEGLVLGNMARMPSVMCRRLREVLPNAHILIVVRNQRDILWSRYQHDVRKGLGASYKRFVTHSRFEPIRKRYYFDAIVGLYRESFERVQVMLFERLFSKETTAELLRFMGLPDARFEGALSAPVNRGLTSPVVKLTRALNCVLATYYQEYDRPRLHNLWRYRIAPQVDQLVRRVGWGAAVRRPPDLDELIVDRYRDSNRNLQRFFDFDIREYGYLY
jgi:Sulfotransferase domain